MTNKFEELNRKYKQSRRTSDAIMGLGVLLFLMIACFAMYIEFKVHAEAKCHRTGYGETHISANGIECRFPIEDIESVPFDKIGK